MKNYPEEFKQVSETEFHEFMQLHKFDKGLAHHTIAICEPALSVYYLEDNEDFFKCTWLSRIDMDWKYENGETINDYHYFIRI